MNNPLYRVNLNILKKQKSTLLDVILGDPVDSDKITVLDDILKLLNSVHDYVEENNIAAND
jgi:hypothetical protein